MGLVKDIGHLILLVGNMEKALRLYRDALGLRVRKGEAGPVWTPVDAKGGSITLLLASKPTPLVLRDGDGSPLTLHVANFEVAAKALRRKGYRVRRVNAHSGILTDPWGNRVGLHDHRKDQAP